MQKRINLEYAGLWQEIPLLLLFPLVKKCESVSNERLLIVTPSLVGEFAASVPAIAKFIRSNPEKKVSLYVAKPVANLAKRIVGVDEVYVRGGEIQASFEEVFLVRMTMDDFFGLLKVPMGKINSNGFRLYKYALHLQNSLLRRKTPVSWSRFISDFLHQEVSRQELDQLLKFSPEENNRVRELLKAFPSGKKVLVHTGTNWIMKHWPKEKWSELLRQISKAGDFNFIFIGAKNEQEDYQYVSEHSGAKVFSLISELSLPELAMLMSKCDYFLGIDSGPGNLAHLTGLPSLIIYGPGPHIYFSDLPSDRKVDKSRGRGFFQMFFAKRNGFIDKIEVTQVYQEFLKLYGTN